jgi:DNA polymerase-3 subunit alpha/error-prone DNA polymerase
MFPLRVRSFYSLQRGTASPAELCRQVRQLGFSGLAMTDRDNLYGLWDFLAACRDQQLKPIIGAEISEPRSLRLVTCLVQDIDGYRNLCRLLTRRHSNGDFSLARDMVAFGEGLVVLTSDKVLLDGYQRQGLAVFADLGARPTAHGRQLRSFAHQLGVETTVTADSDLLADGDLSLYLLVRAIGENTTLSAVSRDPRASAVEVLADQSVYRQRFAVWPEAVDLSDKIVAQCSFTGPDFGIVMPPWKGDGGTEKPATVLRAKAYAGAQQRYGEDLGEPVVERLEHELKIIEQMGFSSYFLVVRDIVHRKENGRRKKRRICGRGSGAASLVAYCLDITNVCPIKYNLYFERFLNPGRTDSPDIDIDFAWDERDQVLNDVLRDYAGYSAMVCNHVFYQPRMAIRETARVFGLPGGEISQLTGRMGWMSRTSGTALESRLAELPALRDQDLSEPWPEILRLAERLIGLPRYLSVHPGGVIITPNPIDEYVPIEIAAKGVPIIQWEKDGAEEAGLVKIDLLGNRSLGVIRDSIASLARRNIHIDENLWLPENDHQTRLSVAEGATMGCFYIESPAMRLLQKKAGSGDFEQLVIQSSIIRPAANEFVREYVRRLHGGAWQPLCPQLGDVLDETFGLMVYQEDVSKVAVTLAGFTPAEGDGLRKVMSKKDRLRRLESYRLQFFDGCKQRGIDSGAIDKLWQMMMSFDGYSFCKPHSASYARVSYQAAFLKKWYPAEFMAAVISNHGGFYSTFAYVSEAKRLGLQILPPDVQESERCWSGVGRQLQVGLERVRGLSSLFLQHLFHERCEKKFVSLEDFFRRTNPADDEARMLIHCGALDSLASGRNRTELLWQWACFSRTRQAQKGVTLFDVRLPPPPPLPPPSPLMVARREYEVLGFLCNSHPLAFAKIPQKRIMKVRDLPTRIGQRVSLALWLLTGKLVSTRTGEVMEFLTFEDDTGMVETTFFPDVYKKHAHLLTTGRGYVVSGLVDEDYGALTLEVSSLRPL